MPHIIIEYSEDIISHEGAKLLVDTVFVAAEESGMFEPLNIKVRAVPVRVYRLGLSAEGFIHVQCRIHAGRPTETKKALTSDIINTLRDLSIDVAVITAEAVDMDRESYSKYCKDA